MREQSLTTALLEALLQQKERPFSWVVAGFPRGVECAYRYAFLYRHRFQFLIGWRLGAVFLGALALVVLLMFSKNALYQWSLGLAGVMAVLGLGGVSSYRPVSFESHCRVQGFVSLLFILAFDVAFWQLPPPLHALALLGVVLVWGHGMLIMRLNVGRSLALLAGFWSLHSLMAWFRSESWMPFLLQMTSMTIAGLLLLSVACLLECGDRQAFLEAELLRLQKEELEARNSLLMELSTRDALTGLDNRRSFEERFDAEWRRALRLGQPLGVMVIDVDAFKQYNDSCGHVEGDTCLRQVADVISRCARRPGDIVARFGGEEFVVVWPNARVDDMLQEANRLRRDVEALAIHHPKAAHGRHVTVSVGVACDIPSEGLGTRELFECADTALYRAKRQGRNRVELGVMDDYMALEAAGDYRLS